MSTPTNTLDAAKRESPLEPGAKLERRLPPFYALFFYAFAAVLAWILLYHNNPGRSLELWAPPNWASCLGIGIAAGAILVGLSILVVKRFAWARALEAEFGWILGAQRGWEIAWVALLSGCAEEYLFRGALQEVWGVWLAAAVFALIHWPVNRNFLPWPFVAGVIGLGLGGLVLWTGSLLAPVTAHVIVNGVNLWRMTRRYRTWDEARVNAFVETGKWS
ncbi:MAG: CPBP family glutamic-type intramembrane protease [Planctomycetota bacterium]|nr:CPBP family glutamic-type intramembrane protease [Planctomycetota bacterium]